MIILHLTSLWKGGGAADYTRNIHSNLLADGYHSYVAVAGYMLVTPEGKEIEIHWSQISRWERLKKRIDNKFFRERNPQLDYKFAGLNLRERLTPYNAKDLVDVLPETPDVILVHWVSGFANAKYVRELQRLTKAKVFYIMIDEAILSGGCHYPWDCNGYQHGCKNCKMTNSRTMKMFIRWNYLFKKYYLIKEKNVIAPTEFDLIRLKKSPLWKGCSVHKLIEVINEELFHPLEDKMSLRATFSIPQNKKVVFFGCSNLGEIRKGMPVLIEALKKISRKDFVYLVAGRNRISELPSNMVYLGHLDMETLAKAYQASDIFVCPSLEDSGPQMINMAIMSGVPTIAFEMGVALDIVITGKTGYRAKFNDAEDLARGINYLLDLPEGKMKEMSKYCRELALKTFSRQCQHEFFNKLFQK